jgi:hypothetical protein
MNGATDKPLFSRRLLLGFLGFAICSFALSLYLMGRSDHGADRYGPSSYSISALGYAGIGEVLQELGIPVAKSRRNPHIQARNGVLIVAEPQLNRLPQSVVPVLPDAEKVLLVLPKWRALDRGERRGWIEKAERILSQQIEGILRLVADKAYVERRSSVEQWTTNTIGVAPELVRQVQLIKSGLLKPIVAAGDGILVGELREDDRLIWVLSDPDVIANHALSPEGKGFSFAIALINTIRGSGPVVFDETVHGFQLDASQSAFRLLFEFPYVIITVQMVIGVALLLRSSRCRRGAARRWQGRAHRQRRRSDAVCRSRAADHPQLCREHDPRDGPAAPRAEEPVLPANPAVAHAFRSAAGNKSRLHRDRPIRSGAHRQQRACR